VLGYVDRVVPFKKFQSLPYPPVRKNNLIKIQIYHVKIQKQLETNLPLARYQSFSSVVPSFSGPVPVLYFPLVV